MNQKSHTEISPGYTHASHMLQAVLKKDETLLDSLLEANGNANYSFDGIPLVAIAAAQDVPLPIIQRLVEKGHVDLRVRTASEFKKYHDKYAHEFTYDNEALVYLLAEHACQEILNHPTEKPQNFNIGQFNVMQGQALLFSAYDATKKQLIQNSIGVIPIFIENDRNLPLVENRTLVCLSHAEKVDFTNPDMLKLLDIPCCN